MGKGNADKLLSLGVLRAPSFSSTVLSCCVTAVVSVVAEVRHARKTATVFWHPVSWYSVPGQGHLCAAFPLALLHAVWVPDAPTQEASITLQPRLLDSQNGDDSPARIIRSPVLKEKWLWGFLFLCSS